jgi:hypothetical protein
MIKMSWLPLRSDTKAITPPPLPLSGGMTVVVGDSVGGASVRVGVRVGMLLAVSVGGTVVAEDETFPHPLKSKNRNEAKVIIFFICEDISCSFFKNSG